MNSWNSPMVGDHSSVVVSRYDLHVASSSLSSRLVVLIFLQPQVFAMFDDDLELIPTPPGFEDTSEEIESLLGDAMKKNFIEGDGEVSLEGLLKNQLIIADKLQKLITEHGDRYSSKDLKDLISVTNTLVVNSHRAGETLKELTTYRQFFETIIEFIRQRQDSFGSDLLQHLKNVAEEMKTDKVLKSFTSTSSHTSS